VGDGSILFPSSNVFAGLADPRTHDPMERRDYVEFLDATCGYDPREYFKVIRDLDAPALDFLNVRYLIRGPGSRPPGPKWRPVYSGADGTVFESVSALPRVFSPRKIRFINPERKVPGANAMARFGASFREAAATEDWRERAYLLSGEKRGEIENAPVMVSDFRESTNAASFRTTSSSSGPSYVVLSMTQDGGWGARDEAGKRLPVHHANGPFLAVEVAPGAQGIRLDYRPPGLRTGLILSLATLGAAVAALVTRRNRTR
jgi:hypothetical protein